jgi:hypothetical protein
MKPSDAEIESVYMAAMADGFTRDQVDSIATPMISRLGGARGLADVRSHGELRAISAALQQAATAADPCRPASDREGRLQAKRSGVRHGVRGEVWDHA